MIKHPLQNSWTLWFFKNDKTKQWEENQREIITFNTVKAHTLSKSLLSQIEIIRQGLTLKSLCPPIISVLGTQTNYILPSPREHLMQ